MEEKLKLLVVDDEPDNLDLLYRTFRREFRVFKAASGTEALDILNEQGEMAIIISDQRMPQMNGTEFLSYTVERFPDTIRMVLTGYTDVEDLVSAINSGKVFKYITKPWNPAKLKDVVIQAAETYRVIKQRTRVLSRALAQESLSNDIMTAVRGSLDYSSTLKTVVKALGQAFDTDLAILYPVDALTGDTQSSLIYRSKSEIENPVFGLDFEALPPLHSSLEIISEPVTIQTSQATRIVVPFLEHNTPIATICLYKATQRKKWADNAVELLNNVCEQVALAMSHAKLYQRIHRQSVQMRAELDVARQIQSNLLHQSWPEIEGIKIQARCQPAREVGGDFFEVFMHPQGDIWLAVGDVSGKGVPAALFMASSISVLRRELAQEKSPEPEKVMCNLNHSLSNDLMNNNCFITMALIRYSPKTGQLVYANAGHVYPIVWPHRAVVLHRDSGSAVATPTYLDVRGVPLGILPNWKAAAGELMLSIGDVLLLTSDGITEATVPSHRGGNGSCSMLNQEGLWDYLQQQPADLDLDHLLAYIHLPEGEQEDDQTILSLEVTSC
jgi:serine phosphatase RsbU (regulator of sigma subunit)/FixJ family two-component response regulator